MVDYRSARIRYMRLQSAVFLTSIANLQDAIIGQINQNNVGKKQNSGSREKMRKLLASETKEQEALFRWAAIKRLFIHNAESGIPERINLSDYMFAIPNGGSRHILEAVNLKRQGVKSGVPDIFLSLPSKRYHGMFIELKRVNNFAISKQQHEWIDKLNAAGYCARIAKGWEKAKEMIEEYLG